MRGILKKRCCFAPIHEDCNPEKENPNPLNPDFDENDAEVEEILRIPEARKQIQFMKKLACKVKDQNNPYFVVLLTISVILVRNLPEPDLFQCQYLPFANTTNRI